MFTLPLMLLLATQQRPPVDVARLRNTVQTLAAFRTRNTNSPTLREAAKWIADELAKNPGMQVETMHYPIPKSDMVPEAMDAVQVIATLPGRTDRRIIIGAHFDDLNKNAEPFTGVAPGADDNASGVAVMLECARIMSKSKHNNTIVFVAFSGEEQGRLGSAALADRAQKEGWKIDAFLDEDTVGCVGNTLGAVDARSVRLFSDVRPLSNSSELARLIEWTNRQRTVFRVRLVLRPERSVMEGDHLSFSHVGFPAVRFTEVMEDFMNQHTAQDLPKFINYDYLVNVTRATLRSAGPLANAQNPPEQVEIDKTPSNDTFIRWKGNSQHYIVYVRETTSSLWQTATPVGPANDVTIKGKNKYDYAFAVGAQGGVPVVAR